MKNYVVGIDLGGTKISCALADLEGQVISQNTVPTNAQEGESRIVAMSFCEPRSWTRVLSS